MSLSEEVTAVQRSRSRDAVAMAALVLVLLLTGLAAALPWRPQPVEGGPLLARYAPLRDGGAQLAARYDGSGALAGWRSSNVNLMRDGRAVAIELSQQQRNALTRFYFGEESPSQSALLQRMQDVQVFREQVQELSLEGRSTWTATVRFREPAGEYLLAIIDADHNELVFDPPVHFLPADWTPDSRWESSGTVNQADYAFDGRVLTTERYAGALGRLDDCTALQVRLVLRSGDAVLSEQGWRDTYCAGVGLVTEVEFDAPGTVTARVAVLRSDARTPVSGQGVALPPRAPNASQPDNEATDYSPAGWRMTRVGRVRAGSDASASTIAPVFVDGVRPMLLAAAYEGDLTAVDAGDPTGAILWRFHPGGTIYGEPGYDAQRGRIYFGASDKRLYALDERGLFLWSFLTGDNVASRPVVAGDVVVFGSEDRSIYALDADTGILRWRHDTGAAAVSSPALVRTTNGEPRTLAVIGSDDGGVYALNAETGERAWLYVTGGPVEAPVVSGQPGPTDPVVYAASRSGELVALNGATGEVVWSANSGRVLRTAPAAGFGRVFVVDEEGFLSAYDAATGRRLWTSLEYDYTGWPVIVDGGLLVASSDGTVYLVGVEGARTKHWGAAEVSEPGDGAHYQFAPTLGRGAAWTVDEQGVVRRLGPRIEGPAPVSLAWQASVGSAPFAMNLVRTTPMHHPDGLLQLDDAGRLYRVDPASGATEYERDLPLAGVRLDPVLAGDLILAARAGSLVAARRSDGQLAWSVGEGLVAQPPVVSGDSVLLVSQSADGSRVVLSAYALPDGRLRWEARFPGTATPGGVVVRGHLAYLSTPPAAYNWRTGVLQWQAGGITGAAGGPALDEAGATLYVGRITPEDRGELVALDAATGAIRWQADLGRLALSPLEAPLLSGTTIVVPGMTGEITALNTETGAERWRQLAGTGRFGGVVLHEGLIWAAYQDGEILGIDAATGEVAARRVAPERGLDGYGFAQRPVVVGDPQAGERLVIAWGSSLRAYNVPNREQ